MPSLYLLYRLDGRTIDPDGPDLGVKIRQAQVVVVRVLVGLNDPERSAEDAGEDKFRLAALARL